MNVPQVKVSTIPLERLDEAWPICAQLLEPAISLTHGRFSLETEYRSIAAGTDELWIIHEGGNVYSAVMVTVHLYPTGLRALVIKFCGGRLLGPWLPVFDQAMVDAARRMKCEKIELVGRSGWVRVGAPFGYRQNCVSIEKDVP